MEKALSVINQMQKIGLVEQFAVGGGIALLFYAEPVLTYDLDIFVFLPGPKKSTSTLLSLTPIYDYLRGRGYRAHKEHIVIEGVPVQFIPAYNDLVEEAVREAVATKYKRIGTKVIRLEYLAAILLQTDRPKDRARIVMLLEESRIKVNVLEDILSRHGLMQKWKTLRRNLGSTQT